MTREELRVKLEEIVNDLKTGFGTLEDECHTVITEEQLDRALSLRGILGDFFGLPQIVLDEERTETEEDDLDAITTYGTAELAEILDMSPKRVSDYVRNFNEWCDEAGIYPVIRPGAERRGEGYKASNDTWHALKRYRKETRRK